MKRNANLSQQMNRSGEVLNSMRLSFRRLYRVYCSLFVALVFLMFLSPPLLARRFWPETDLLPFKSGKLYGYMDRNGKIIIPPRFRWADFFYEGLAVVAEGPECNIPLDDYILEDCPHGYINKKGQYVIKPQFYRALEFRGGFAHVSRFSDFRALVINRSGDIVGLEGLNYFLEPLANGYFCVKQAMQTRMVDGKGKMFALPQGLSYIKREPGWPNRCPSEDLIQVEDQSGRQGFVHFPLGTVVIKPSYDSVGQFSEGMAPVKVGDRWGAIDRSGNIVIEPQFSYVSSFHGGAAAAFVLGDSKLCGLIDKQGKWIVQPSFVQCSDGFNFGMASFRASDKEGEKDGVIGLSGKWIIPLQSRDIELLGPDLFCVDRYPENVCKYLTIDGKRIHPE